MIRVQGYFYRNEKKFSKDQLNCSFLSFCLDKIQVHLSVLLAKVFFIPIKWVEEHLAGMLWLVFCTSVIVWKPCKEFKALKGIQENK